jgi:hypothetical protein
MGIGQFGIVTLRHQHPAIVSKNPKADLTSTASA